ncbi:DgyrCDS1028 [Dimorphilus gyrociliatus]|uniref:DgyrCDS1028 n=1 Tax=Dimorphilus gyrociliatus TaxID=2664684 RepID=A0A7I8V834_9ANNE|nr:DgyrCDS1028 [Dimorphilus gyrociliatus]
MGGSVSIGQTGRPTVFPKEDFDPASSAEKVKNAIDGFGTDESALIKVFASHSNLQRQEIASVFKQSYGKDLQEELKDECGGDFEDVLIALTTPSRLYEARLLRNAMKGAGTDEKVLIEVLATKANIEMKELKAIYEEEYKEDDRKLEVDVENETSGDFKCLLLSLLNADREEIPADEDVATEDATRLHEAGEARFGTDESEFNRILCLRSYDHLQLVLSKYEEMFGESLEDVVNNETSGSIQDGYLTIR